MQVARATFLPLTPVDKSPFPVDNPSRLGINAPHPISPPDTAPLAKYLLATGAAAIQCLDTCDDTTGATRLVPRCALSTAPSRGIQILDPDIPDPSRHCPQLQLPCVPSAWDMCVRHAHILRARHAIHISTGLLRHLYSYNSLWDYHVDWHKRKRLIPEPLSLRACSTHAK
jgi:hypothetical protein